MNTRSRSSFPFSSLPSSSLLIRISATVAAALLLVSCSGGTENLGSPPPASSTRPLSEGELAKVVVAKLKDPGFSGRYSFTGTANIQGTSVPFSGQGEFSGPDSHNISESLGLEQISVQGVAFEKSDDGPWVRQEEALTDPFQRLETLVSVGVEPRNGANLHHLRTPSEFELMPSDLGETRSSISELTGGAEFYVKDDGEPVVIVQSFSGTCHPEGKCGQSVEYTLMDLGAHVVISEPTDAWLELNSTGFGYSIAHPADWEPGIQPPPDGFNGGQTFRGPGARAVTVLFRIFPSGATLSQLVGAEIAADGQPERNQRTSLGGEQARLLTYHMSRGGQTIHFLIALAVHGDRGYVIVWAAPQGQEDQDRSTFEQFISTFEFTV
jgi:hypothetical protein